MATEQPGPSDPRQSVTDWAKQNKKAPPFASENRWLYPAAINGSRWNRLYPYQILVVDQQADGTYIARKSPSNDTSWVFTLPMPPESLTISTPFAINTTATLGGYIEEHNGIVFRMLSLSGSMGVFFGRGEAPVPPDFSNLTTSQAIFAGALPGTTAAISATQSSFNTLVNGRSFATNAVEQSSFNVGGDNETLTGYYQFRLLQLFFESYAELKRTQAGRRSRLAFSIWKQEEIYLCTPVSFDYQRAAPSSPLEYRYSLHLKASKRVKLAPGAADIVKAYTPIQRDPGKLAYFLDKVQQARLVLQNARRTITAIGGDVDKTLFEPMRELCLFAKDALSVPLAIADLADSIIQSTRDAILDVKATANDIKNFPQNAAARGRQVSAEAYDVDAQISALSAEVADDTTTKLSRSAHPANSPFLNPLDNYDYFSNIQVGDLNLRPATVAKIAKERNRVRQLSRLDFEKRRDDIATAAAAFSNALGIGSATYNEVYGVDAPVRAVGTPTDDDYEAIYAMNGLIMEINRLVVTSETDPNPKLDSISVVAGLAQRSGIAFRTPASKFAVPFPYGSTLEMLAARYLNDPNRWFEIVALNGLQSPYVDEEGFKLPLLVSGAGNTVMVANADHLFIGQPVWIESVGVVRSKRRITKIDKLTSNQFFVTVDGDADLDRYTVLAHAFLQAFLPNTINSQMVVYMPSDQEPKDDDFKTKAIPDINEYDQLLSVGGIDLLLTPQNDLVVTPNGDTRWAVGLTNIVQKVRLALSVQQGTLLGHPEYGLPIAVGQSLADVDATDMVRAVNDLFNGDPTFAGVQGVHVDINGPVGRLGLGVVIAGTSQVIPISAEVKQ